MTQKNFLMFWFWQPNQFVTIQKNWNLCWRKESVLWQNGSQLLKQKTKAFELLKVTGQPPNKSSRQKRLDKNEKLRKQLPQNPPVQQPLYPNQDCRDPRNSTNRQLKETASSEPRNSTNRQLDVGTRFSSHVLIVLAKTFRVMLF